MPGKPQLKSAPLVEQQEAHVAARPQHWYERAMERLFSDPAYKGFVLQDRKRLPGRFFAHMCGSLLTRLA